MHGVKGFSRYMFVERDRWLDSPIRRDGRVREDHAVVFRRANQVLKDNGFVDLRRQADVLLLANRDYDRLEAASVLVSFPGDFLETPSGFSEYPSFMTVSEERLGFAQPIQMDKTDWFWDCYRGLTQAGVAFLLSDTALKPDRWSDHKAVIVSSFEFLGAAVQRQIVAFATAGGTVVMGPKLPELDERMQPDTTIRSAIAGTPGTPVTAGGHVVGTAHTVGTGRIVVVTDLSDPASTLTASLEGVGATRFERGDPRIDVTLHASAAQPGRLVVFVANPTPDAIDATVRVAAPVRAARELWDDRPVELVGGALHQAMAPYTIAIFDCQL